MEKQQESQQEKQPVIPSPRAKMGQDLTRLAKTARNPDADYETRMKAYRKALKYNPELLVKTNNGIPYVPVSAVEWLLDIIYDCNWQTRPHDSSLVSNEQVTTVSLLVLHPITGVWIERVGVGAAQIQMDKAEKGEPRYDPMRKRLNAAMLGAPSAKALAFTNAAKSLGKVFGRDVGRKEDQIPQNAIENEEVAFYRLKAAEFEKILSEAPEHSIRIAFDDLPEELRVHSLRNKMEQVIAERFPALPDAQAQVEEAV